MGVIGALHSRQDHVLAVDDCAVAVENDEFQWFMTVAGTEKAACRQDRCATQNSAWSGSVS
jgi:hypothetical protein